MNPFSYGHIWRVAYPVLISLLMESLIGMTDTAFLGRVGEVALGGSALGGTYFMIFFMVGFGFSIGAQILIGRRNGEGNLHEIGPLFRQGLWFMLLLSYLFFAVSHFFSADILGLMIGSDAVLGASVEYVNWRIYGFFFAFISLMFRAYYVGITRTRILTLNSIVMVLSNVGLNYVLIFGKLGVPAMGVAGAAIASSIAEAISAAFFIVYTYARIDWRKYRLFGRPDFSLRLLRQMLDVSVWTMIQIFISMSVWFLFFIAMEHLGERPLAVSNIVRSIAMFVFVILNAFSSTVSSLVSNQIGADNVSGVPDIWRRTIRLCYAIALPLILIIILFPAPFIRIYTNNPELIAASAASVRVAMTAYLIDVPAFILFNVISGTGNTRPAFFLELGTLLLYILYLGYIAFYLRVDVAVCWTAEHVYGIFLILASWLYLKKARWQSKKI